MQFRNCVVFGLSASAWSIYFRFGPEISAASIDRLGIDSIENHKYCFFLWPNIEIFPVLNISTPALLFAVKAHSHEHVITNETSNDKSAQRQTRLQFIHTATSAGRNLDES